MKRNHAISTLFFLVLAQLAIGQVSQDRLHYINKYSHIAQEEMERSGVPASIKLAQAILESDGGKSLLSRKANNHFGIKCGGDWKEGGYNIFDDEVDKRGNKIKSCFRMYKNPESSFIAHSEFLRANKRYEFLFALDSKDYEGWAHGLKKAGYATNPKYPKLLINIIQNYNLAIYDDLFAPGPADENALASTDEEVMMDVITKQQKKETKNIARVTKLNDISVVRAGADDTPEIIAIKTSIPLKRILRYNETLIEPSQAIPEHTVVFLQPKRKAFRGRKKFHKIADGENLVNVSQKYGIRMDKLLKRNRLAKNEEPLEGAILKIRGKRVDKNLEIPTREIYVAGMPSSKEEKKAKDKFATSMSDFEAPPALGQEREDSNRIKRLGFGKKKKASSSKSSDVAANSTNEWTPVKEVKEVLATDVYRAPVTSDNYDTSSTSPNATFKEEMVSSNPTISEVNMTRPQTTTSTYSTTTSASVNSNPGHTSTYSSSTPASTTVPNTSNRIYTGPQTNSSPMPRTENNPQTNTAPSKSTYSGATTTSVPTTTSTYSSVSSTTAPATTSTYSSTSTPVVVQSQYHTVMKGETLYRLSKQYAQSVDYIKQVNGLNSNTISIGQKLIVN